MVCLACWRTPVRPSASSGKEKVRIQNFKTTPPAETATATSAGEGPAMRSVSVVVLLAGTVLFPTIPGVAQQLPSDVHPDSRSRLPLIKREDLSVQFKKAYDAAAASSPTGRPEGVAAIRLHRSGVDVRWDSALGRRLTELAIRVSAREHDQPYEWSLHEMEALSVGLEPEVIDIVRHRKPLTGLGDNEAAIVQLGRELGLHTVTSETYARALRLFGKTNLVDLIELMAQYVGTS